MDHKKRYYIVLTALWFVVMTSCLGFWRIHTIIDSIRAELIEMDKRADAELLEEYRKMGWVPYEWRKEVKEYIKKRNSKLKEKING